MNAAPVRLDLRDDLMHPLPKQAEAMDAVYSHKYILYGGAAGPGKSYWLRWSALEFLLECAAKGLEHVRVGLFCEDYPTLRDRQISRIKREFPEWLGEVKSTEAEGFGFHLRAEYGGGYIALRNLDEPAKYACYHPGTEVLTEGGFKPIAAVLAGERVATFDPRTRVAEYQPVRGTMAYEFDGSLITTPDDKTHVAFAVTPNHRMLGRTRRSALQFVRADQLPSVFHIPRAGHWSGERRMRWIMPPVFGGRTKKALEFDTDTWLRFLGWFIAEGNLDPAPRYGVNLTQLKPEGRAAIRSVLDALGYRYAESPTRFSLWGKALHSALVACGSGAEHKRIPREVLALHPEHLVHLFDGLMGGDGHQYESGRWVYMTTSRGLADDVSELAIKLGMVPTIIPVQNRGGLIRGQTYERQQSWQVSIAVRGDTRLTKTELVPYQGPVYCLDVPPHHTLLIRYRDRVMWCGNSTEFAAEFVDELTKNERQTFDDLRFRLRWPGLRHTPFCAATNPGSRGHGWVKKLWVDGDFSGDDSALNPADFAFIRALPRDNPHLGTSYWEQLDSLPPRMRAALRDGSWEVFQGQAFSEFTRQMHVIRPFTIPDNWTRWTSTDYGYVDPWATVWMARSPDRQRVVVYREAYERGLTAQQQAQRLKQLTGKEPIRLSLGDPSMWAQREKLSNESIADEYAMEGVSLSPANNDRLAGKARLHEALAWEQLAARTNPPRLQIFDTCVNLIRELETLPLSETRPEDVETKGVSDHAYDALRYALMVEAQRSNPERTEAPAYRRIEIV